MLYEIISPDAFLRSYLDNYATLSAIYAVVRKAFTKKAQPDRAFQRKTNELVQAHIDTGKIDSIADVVEISSETIELIKKKQGGDNIRVINLVKSIEKTAEENGGDPFLIGMAQRALAVQESFEDRQKSTEQALSDLFVEIERNEQRKREQAAKGLDDLTFFVYKTLCDAGISAAERASKQISYAFLEFPNWNQSEKDQRNLRQRMTFALYAHEDDLEKVTATVEHLLDLLRKTQGSRA